MGYFCNKIYCQEIKKIAKSGHTAYHRCRHDINVILLILFFCFLLLTDSRHSGEREKLERELNSLEAKLKEIDSAVGVSRTVATRVIKISLCPSYVLPERWNKIECSSFIEIYWSLVTLVHFMTFTMFLFFHSTQH